MSINALPVRQRFTWPITSAVISVLTALLVNQFCPFMIDECGSWSMANSGVSTAFQRSVVEQGQAPLYFIMLSLWINWFGDSQMGLRSLSVLCNACSSLLLALIFTRLGGQDRISKFSLLCVLFSPLWLGYMTLARPYALAVLEVTLVLLVALCIATPPIRIILLAALGALSVLTHYFFVLPLLVLSGLGGMYRSRWREVYLNVSASGFGSLCGLLLISRSVKSHFASLSMISFSTPPDFSELVGSVALLPWFPGPIIILVLIWRRARSSIKRSGIIELLLSAAMALSLFIASHLLNGTLFLLRYLTICLPVSGLSALRAWQYGALTKIRLEKLIVFHVLVVVLLSLILISRQLRPEGMALANIKKSIERESREYGCPLIASSLYIESVNPQLFSLPGLQPFLRAPYVYQGSDDFELLPLGFQSSEEIAKYAERIEEKILREGCVQLVLLNVSLHNQLGPIIPSYISLGKALRERGYVLEEVRDGSSPLLVHGRVRSTAGGAPGEDS